MQLTVRLNESDVKVGRDNITLHLSIPSTEAIREQIQKLVGKEVSIEVKQYREKRSLNANAYFFVLVEKLANALRMPKPYIHNLMLQKYGQVQRIDGRPIWVILPDDDTVQSRVENDSSLHLRATSEIKIGKDNKPYRTYVLLKGSHELDTREFSILLDGIISECNEQNIPTATPEEIRKMKEMWGVKV